MNKYRLVEAPIDENWDKLIEDSENGTAFATRAYLESVGMPIDSYYCLKGDEPMAAFFVPVNKQRTKAIGHDFIIYDGLIYRNFPKLNRSQRFSEQFKIQEAVSNALVDRYESIRLSLHPSIKDIRPFLWFNYGTDLLKYKINLRYTSYVYIGDFASSEKLEDIEIYKEASVARRQEIRYAIKKDVMTEESLDINGFISYYLMTMERQEIVVDEIVQQQMSLLLNRLIKRGMILQIVSKDATERIGSRAIYLIDNKRAYYLFGASDPKMRSSHTGTAVLWDAFYKLSRRGIKVVDLEGINSPNRGWFKLSFGGEINPYYEVSIKDDK